MDSTILATTLFIFFLLPGFIFFRGFWGSDKGFLQSTNLYHYLMWGTIASVIIYPISYLAFNKILDFLSIAAINPEDVIHYYETKNYKELIDSFYKIVLLSLLADIIAVLSSILIRKSINLVGWDIKHSFFRWRNDWYYVLSGRGIKFNKLEFPNGFATEVDVLTEVGNSIILYRGTVKEYRLNNEDLQYLRLEAVRRTSMIAWEEIQSGYKLSLPPYDQLDKEAINLRPTFYKLHNAVGEKMVFTGKEIKNIYVRYIPLPPN